MTSPITAASLGVPPVFNAATHFVDRHIRDGIGARVAIECGDERVTYAALARAREPLRDRAARRARRPARRARGAAAAATGRSSIVAFFGAIKIGAVPIPTNTLWTTADYEFVLHDSRARVVDRQRRTASEDRRDRCAPRRPSLAHIGRRRGRAACRATSFDAGRRRIAEPRRRADQPRRARVLAVFVGQHRRSRRGACTCSTT